MSLVDRTNEEIDLSMELPAGVVLKLDIDSDSSLHPEPWVWLEVAHTLDDSEDHSWRVTMAEAGLAHDRLGVILGRPMTVAAPLSDIEEIVDIYQRVWDEGEPKLGSNASIRDQLDSQFRFRLARRLLLEGYRKVGTSA